MPLEKLIEEIEEELSSWAGVVESYKNKDISLHHAAESRMRFYQSILDRMKEYKNDH
jgi:hypothetical protein